MIKCGLKIEGLNDKKIKKTFYKTLDFFENKGYRLKNKVKFIGGGKVEIKGQGKDGRCAFCEYFRRALEEHFFKDKTKGTIELINCPFNPDERISYTPETIERRKKLMDLFPKKFKEK